MLDGAWSGEFDFLVVCRGDLESCQAFGRMNRLEAPMVVDTTGRTIVKKALPSRRSSAASIFFCNALSDAARAPKTTLPLDSRVFTSVKPADSNACFTSGIFAFIGLTPRRNAT